ncbi:MAG TPA: MATE family efflux transporter [Candidatus Obscuribacterales bacterium]
MTEKGATSTDASSALKANLVEGSLIKAIWTMSWPLMLTTISSSLIGMADLHVAGFLGSASQAAVGVSEQIIFIYLIFIMSTGVGTQALVSRATGAGDENEVNRITGQSIMTAFFLGLVLLLLSLFASRPVLSLFTQSGSVLSLASTYLSIYAFYLIPFSFINIVNASFRAIGDARTQMFIMLVTTAVNIAGDYLTVCYRWPVPGLGVAGIAWSAVIASAVGSTIAWHRLSHSPLRQSLNQLFPASREIIRRILNIGIPSALQRLAWGLSTFVLFFILSRCPNPTEALASWSIGMRIEGLLFMPLMALGLGVASIVGQNLGAERPQRAVQAGWQVTLIGVAMMVMLGGLMFAFATELAQVMTRDDVTIKYTASYIRWNAIAEPILAIGMILSSALQGAGDTRTPMWITYLCTWVIRLPMAWILAISIAMGPHGVWISMCVSNCLTGLLTAWRFQSKAWLRIKI